ncbi:hypothetical protein FRC17_001297, partial [Serendipita sp. 399]
MSVDGVRQSWNTALNIAQNELQLLLTSATSPLWRRVPSVSSGSTPESPLDNSEEARVVIHKRPSKQGEIFRLVLDVPAEDFSINAWKSVLATPEMRQEWDPAVESSQLLEIYDVDVRIAKTYFTLGWPAKTLSDGATLLDVTTSLPRSPDEPPYLRSTPPYVRSHVNLFAWVIQQVPQATSACIRITLFWQHDLKAVWGIGMPSRAQHLSSLMVGVFKTVNKFGARIPMLQGFGLGVGMERMVFDVGRQSLMIEYSILHEEEGDNELRQSPMGVDELRAKKERRRLERSVEFVLPKKSSWDVQLLLRASTAVAASSPWMVNVYSDDDELADQDQLLLRTRHSLPASIHAVVKVKLVIEAAAGPAGLLRLNGTPHPIEALDIRDPTPLPIPEQLIQDAMNVGTLTFPSSVGLPSQFSDEHSRTMSIKTAGRPEGVQKSILKLVRRNYVYFASLLQEPEVKWKPLVESRGVAVTQLDSIDSTLVVYKAEAVFVGVGIWDLISVISTPGASIYWDKGFDSASLIEDVSELSQLWHHKTRAAWPVNARESVLLTSTYKSPTSVHIFSFSTDDSQLFPNIPASDPNVIRTQVDLRGWAIEALSPTTTQVTLIEQSDPKGWSNKSSLPQQIISAVSGVGEFVIKCGGPPILSRLGGARALIDRYDHDKATFRLEYEVDTSRRVVTQHQSTPMSSMVDLTDTASVSPLARPFVECELRCDIELWGGPIEVVVDPPPQSVSCLRRHRLSDNGGGLWITIEHDSDFVMGERLRVVVRKGASTLGKDKNVVLVNGSKAKVEVEDLPEAEIKQLAKRKRVKPLRIPLDQPPVVSAMQRRRAEWAGGAEPSPITEENGIVGSVPRSSGSTLLGNSFGRFMTMAVSQATSSTTSAVSAIAKPFALTEQSVPNPTKQPVQHALDAMAYLRSLYTRPSQDGWVQVANNAGLVILKKLETEVSRTIHVHKADKVIEGVTAEEVINAISFLDCQKQWDDRFDSATVLQDYGYGCQTSFMVAKGAFPFQPRGFYIASIVGRADGSSLSAERQDGAQNPVYYHASTSFNPESIAGFSPAKYNTSNYAIGRVLIRGWILETLDPYTAENYAIPSTRCTFVSAIDFAGAVPVAYNAMLNVSQPRAILQLESFLKSNVNLPVFHHPAIGVSVEPTEGPQEGWNLTRRDAGFLLVGRRYSVEQRSFRATILVDAGVGVSSSISHDVTPTPSRIVPPQSPSKLQNNPQMSPTDSEFDRPRSPNRSTFNSIGRNNSTGRNGSLAVSPVGRRNPIPSFSSPNVNTSKDIILTELVVDSKLYPNGFSIRTSSLSGVPEESIDLPENQDLDTQTHPLVVSVYSLSSNLYKASFSERSGPRYLIRLSLPTARYDIPLLEDPLTGQ